MSTINFIVKLIVAIFTGIAIDIVIYYLSVTHPVDALDTDRAYLSKTP